MRQRLGVVIVTALMLVAAGSASAAQPRRTCPGVTDPRGDAVFREEVRTPYQDVSLDRDGGWDIDAIDILSLWVAADQQYLTTTVQVAALSDDPVHGAVWRVWLEWEAAHPRERLEVTTRHMTGGDVYSVRHEYQAGTSVLGGPGMMSEDEAVTGTIDIARGLISVRIPLTLLDRWHIRRNARLRDLHGQARPAAGIIVAGAVDTGWSEGESRDETDYTDPHSRLNTPRCAARP